MGLFASLWKLAGNCYQFLDVDVYLLPKSEDLMVSLTKGRNSQSLIFSSAYQQMPLTDKSKQVLAIIHTWDYTATLCDHYTWLPFGVASQPALLQMAVDEIL